MSISAEEMQWRSQGGATDVFGRRYDRTQVMMKKHYRGEDNPGPRQTRYLSPLERDDQQISFLSGCVHWMNRPFARPSDGLAPGDYIYVITVDGNFLAIEQQPTDMREVHHSTIPSGKGLICAGHMTVGISHRLVKVDNNSGHYMPDLSCLLKAVYLLRKSGCAIDNFAVGYVPPVGYGSPSMLDYDTARDFLIHAPYS
ncbi:hypothetical protein EC912_102192 [Luteibacter rhizovicinus]|uniref:Uncharacterized protein n=1 Tax=Luteibacter rhizovicinus TaxID=242606 RepID=A0A4R3YSG8_9GAMM|nr:hypothetical protein [Luteibacter rhizovicinus]TCV95847.1 hypothetical protein EC912_102192 [Luteibacter rhizovicinus]